MAADLDPTYRLFARYYTYDKIVNGEEGLSDSIAGRAPPPEAIDFENYNVGALAKYGKWRILSNGPDRKYYDESFRFAQPVLLGSDVPYDPTNGTTSFGNILRTHESPEGRVIPWE